MIKEEKAIEVVVKYMIWRENLLDYVDVEKLEDIYKEEKELWKIYWEVGDNPHHGDCTNVPMSCSRCYMDDLIGLAKKELETE